MSVAGNDPVVATTTVLDLTAFGVLMLNGLVVPLVAAVLLALVDRFMKNKQAAQILETAIINSEGYAKKVIDAKITSVHPSVAVSLDNNTATRLQYVLDHAGAEIDRIYRAATPMVQGLIAQKIVRSQGAAELAVERANTGPTVTTQVTSDPPSSTTTITPGAPPSAATPNNIPVTTAAPIPVIGISTPVIGISTSTT